jgi:SiaC family regulatory phosphoprotein
MEPILIEKTFSTPGVKFSPSDFTLVIEGRVIPEDATAVFQPIVDWVNAYFSQGNNKLIVIFRLYYYNTSSSKRIVNFLKVLDEFFLKGKEIQVKWEYEEGDDDCMRDGQDYQAMIKLPLELVETPELE